MTKKFSLLPAQAEFLESNAKHTALVAGFGSGKSVAGCFKTIVKKLIYPEYPVAYYLPTYGLIRDIAFPKFTELLNQLDIRYVLNKSDKEIIIKGANKIIFRSMDNPETIVGYEVAYSCIDEADILPEVKMSQAFIKIIARNRAKLHDGHNSTDVVSTPEGFRWLYKFFVKEASDNKNLIKAKTYDNPFLPQDYIDTLKESYTVEQLDAYLSGEFVNLTSGIVYRNFDRTRNYSDRQIKPMDVLHVGMDFNIMNMAAVIHVVDKIPIAVAELTGVYDTEAMIRLLKQYGNKVVVYPDASGKNRNTSGKSDVKLLKDAGFTVRVLSKNPFVRDRVNAMNAAFLNSNNQVNYKVNTDNCPVYTEALEQQGYNNGEPDKTTGHDHINDAAGYYIFSKSKKRQKVY